MSGAKGAAPEGVAEGPQGVVEPEQAAMLEQLQAEAAGEAPVPGSPEAMAAEEAASRPPVDLAAEFDGLLEIMIGTAAVQVPELSAIWTPEKRRDVADRAAAVCAKRGWLQEGIFGGGYAEEIALLLTLAPLAFATWKAIKEALAKMKPGAKQAAEVMPQASQAEAAPMALARG